MIVMETYTNWNLLTLLVNVDESSQYELIINTS